jgi:hypothetical protein
MTATLTSLAYVPFQQQDANVYKRGRSGEQCTVVNPHKSLRLMESRSEQPRSEEQCA